MRELLPFERLDRDGKTLVCKRKRIARGFRLNGLDHAGASQALRASLRAARAAALNELAQDAVEHRMICVREEVASHRDEGEEEGADAELPAMVRTIARRWDRSTGERLYRNRHYWVSYARDTDAGRSALDHCEVVLETVLAEYEPRVLSVEGESPLAPYAGLVAAAARACAMPAPGLAGVGALLATDDVWFPQAGELAFEGAGRTVHMEVVQMRSVPDQAEERLALELMRLAGEVTVVHALRPIAPAAAIFSMGREAKVARGGEGTAAGAGDQAEEALQMVQGTHASGARAALFSYSLNVFAFGGTREEARSVAQGAERAIALGGGAPVRGGTGGEAAYWHTFPTWEVAPRPWRFLTPALARWMVPQSAPQGLTRHDWGETPITRFRSAQGAGYGFTWHAEASPEAPGHCFVVAPNGAGKTTLVSHLAAMSLRKPRVRVWLFDRQSGAEIFTLCAGGRYVRPEAGEEAGEAVRSMALNPFHLPDSPTTRDFLVQWLMGLIGEQADESDEAQCRLAVNVAYDQLPLRLRSLRHLHRAVFPDGSRARRRLGKWAGVPGQAPDAKSALFNAENDDLAQLNARVVGYDCTRAFDDPELAGPLLSYLLHRIQSDSEATGSPALVYIDETEPMLRNPQFLTFFRRLLQEGRKMRQVCISCFQRPSAIAELGLEDLVRGQSPTTIFLRNPMADREWYASYELSEPELDFVLGRTHRELAHAALIKRYAGPHTAIVDTSLAPLGPYLRTYASGRPNVIRYRNLVAQNGIEAGGELYVNTG